MTETSLLVAAGAGGRTPAAASSVVEGFPDELSDIEDQV